MSDCPATLNELKQVIATYKSEINNFTALYNANLVIGFVVGFISMIASCYVLFKTYRVHSY